MRLQGGVRVVDGPSVANVRLLDGNAMPWVEAAAGYGLQVDLDHFAKLSKELDDEMEDLGAKVHQMTGSFVNLNSGDQVSHLLFKKLGLKQARLKMVRSGDREAVDGEVLEAIKHDHEVVPLILAFKECSKINGTYVKPMPKLARKAGDGTWRMYPNFSVTRIPSGRFAARDPNLLAIPAHSKRGKRVRQGFITKPGWKILTVDMSQIEPRIAAHRSKCQALIDIYLNGQDVYSEFAITAFKLDPYKYQDDKGKWHYPAVHGEDHRFPAKTCTLASLYRVTAPGLLAQMPVGKGWTEPKVQDLINAFYIKYREILEMYRLDDGRAKKCKMVWDMFGRFLHTPGVCSVHPWIVSATLREAGNQPIQGSACGVLKLAMASTHNIWEQAGLQDVIHPLLPIHDELLYEAREDMVEEWIDTLSYEFEHTVPLLVPIHSSGSSAENWGTLDKG